MKKRLLACIVAAALCFSLAACADPETNYEVSVNGDGYVVVNGETTDVKVPTESTPSAPTDPVTVTAYEMWKQDHPDYTGSEDQWMQDLTTGLLADKHVYTPVRSGNYDGTLAAGAATAIEPNSTDYGSSDDTSPMLELKNAVISLREPIVLPIDANASWEITIEGILMPDGNGGGQFFSNNSPEITDGRLYFGINKANKVIYMGAYIQDRYLNYCWDASDVDFSQKHTYTFSLRGGVYYMSVDGSNGAGLCKLNENNGAVNSGTAEQLSTELSEKIYALSGQKFLTLAYMGTQSFPLNMNLYSVKCETSSIYGYKTLGAHPLHNKNIYYLGSSITLGNNGDTEHCSFANMIHSLTGNPFYKEAIDGTPLAGGGADSYTARMDKTLPADADAVVVQLSTNDFSQGRKVGDVTAEDVVSPSAFDKNTICGSIEYIIAKAKTRRRQVYFYTCIVKNNWSHRAAYENFIQNKLKAVCDKWNVVLIDTFNAHYTQVGNYMNDDIHPNRVCYATAMTPRFMATFLDNM